MKYIRLADDVTQIIISNYRNVPDIASRAAREIKNINDYEKKINTKKTKFNIIPIKRRKLGEVIVDEELYEYNSKGKVLGLKIAINGYNKHREKKINRSKALLLTLYKFRNLN